MVLKNRAMTTGRPRFWWYASARYSSRALLIAYDQRLLVVGPYSTSSSSAKGTRFDLPYTSELEAMRIGAGEPAGPHAAAKRSIAAACATFVSIEAIGSAMMSCTPTAAARWYTWSKVSPASSVSSARARSHSIQRSRGCTTGRLILRPVERSSTTVTWSPSETRMFDRRDPMNPAPPLTRQRRGEWPCEGTWSGMGRAGHSALAYSAAARMLPRR